MGEYRCKELQSWPKFFFRNEVKSRVDMTQDWVFAGSIRMAGIGAGGQGRVVTVA